MGRHGGGSRGGGRSSSRSSGGSRGSRSSTRVSRKPFHGCYNRSYLDRRGVLHTCYTTNRNFGTKSGWNGGVILMLIFITVHMLIMLAGILPAFLGIGKKIDGDRSRIFIEDRIDILSDAEEQEILELFDEVYDRSGMPVALYTDDFSWKSHYTSLEVYSEELYYSVSYREDAMVILFTADNSDGFFDWEYDMYCGDDTTKCLSDAEFEKLLDNFQKGMSGQQLPQALDYAWDSVMDEIGKTNVNWAGFPAILMMAAIYGLFYFAILGGVRKQNAAYKYFSEHPENLSMEPMTLYSVCPTCGASNSQKDEECRYCGALLKVREGNVNYVNPNDIRQ